MEHKFIKDREGAYNFKLCSINFTAKSITLSLLSSSHKELEKDLNKLEPGDEIKLII